MHHFKAYLITIAIFYLIAAWLSPWASLGAIAIYGLLQVLAMMYQERLVARAITQFILDHPEIIEPRQPDNKQDDPNEV